MTKGVFPIIPQNISSLTSALSSDYRTIRSKALFFTRLRRHFLDLSMHHRIRSSNATRAGQSCPTAYVSVTKHEINKQEGPEALNRSPEYTGQKSNI